MLENAARPLPAWTWQRRLPAAALVVVALAALAWADATRPGLPTSLRLEARLQVLTTVFLGIVIEAVPFLLIGVLASAAIQIFVSPDRVRRHCPENPFLAALSGGLLGLTLLPMCECGTVPTTRRLLAKGAPLPFGIAFLLAAPAVNPIVLVSTWIAFRGQPLMVVGRFGLTLLIAVTIGLVLGTHPRPDSILTSSDSGDPHDHCATGQCRPAEFVRHASVEFFEMGRFLVIGALIAATFQALVPRDVLLTLGRGPVVSVLALMALAVILSICSTVDAFVALSFVGSFAPGAILAFLVFGPMIDLKSVLLFRTTFRGRTVALLVLLAAQLVLLAAVAINYYIK